MQSLTRLRIFITLAWLIYIGEVFTVQFYDPSLHSPLLHAANTMLDNAIKQNTAFFFFLIVEATLIIYASAALWFGYLAGKGAFTIYIVFAILDNLFISVQAFSSLNMILTVASYIILGMILHDLYSSPLKEELALKKPLHFWKVFIAFFIFFVLFFALPLMFSYFFKS